MYLKTNSIFRYRRAKTRSFQDECDGNRVVSAYIAGHGCIRCQPVLTYQLHLMPARTSGGLRVDGGSHVQSVLTNVAWLNNDAAAECGCEIRINILVHIINASSTSSPRPARLLGIIRYVHCFCVWCRLSCHKLCVLKQYGMSCAACKIARQATFYVKQAVSTLGRHLRW